MLELRNCQMLGARIVFSLEVFDPNIGLTITKRYYMTHNPNVYQRVCDWLNSYPQTVFPLGGSKVGNLCMEHQENKQIGPFNTITEKPKRKKMRDEQYELPFE